jgi:ComF family protein
MAGGADRTNAAQYFGPAVFGLHCSMSAGQPAPEGFVTAEFGRGSRLAAMAIAAAALLQAWGRTALDVVYPPHCLACAASTLASNGLCGDCWRRISFIERPFCERLGTPFHQDLGAGLLSPEAIAHPPAFGRARAVALFDDGPAKRLVHRLKYGDRPEVARLLGRWMARAASELAEGAPVLVPMPLHRTRLLRRQFNQAALLADAIARASGLTCEVDLLHRVKATAPQVGMSRAQRATNVQGAFRVPPPASVAGRRVLLVDDVLTTGATANAAARALLRGGAESVDLVVFARVAGAGGIAI